MCASAGDRDPCKVQFRRTYRVYLYRTGGRIIVNIVSIFENQYYFDPLIKCPNFLQSTKHSFTRF